MLRAVGISRIYDLTTMPSRDSRYETAEGDIWQHCINNDDWPLDWIYSDPRFRLYATDQETLLKFICEVVHPIVRTDAEEQAALVQAFNGHLTGDGWELVEDTVLAGRPVFEAQRKVHAC